MSILRTSYFPFRIYLTYLSDRTISKCSEQGQSQLDSGAYLLWTLIAMQRRGAQGYFSEPDQLDFLQ